MGKRKLQLHFISQFELFILNYWPYKSLLSYVLQCISVVLHTLTADWLLVHILYASQDAISLRLFTDMYK